MIFLHLAAIVLVFAVFVALHAFKDASYWLKKAQEMYNSQPRVKKLEPKLKWPARIISFITFKKL